jgi:hypothetical protein
MKLNTNYSHKGDDKLVSRCLRCGEFKEREEMESRTTEGYPIVVMCKDCWKKVDAIDASNAPDEFDCNYNSHAVCPYCGYVDYESYELEGDDGECSIVDCCNCERQYRYIRHIDVSYSTSKINWLDEWRCYNRGKINRHNMYDWIREHA